MNIEISNDFINELIALAQCTTVLDRVQDEEDTCVEDFAGGNVDDAFDNGIRSGHTELARRILNQLNVKW